MHSYGATGGDTTGHGQTLLKKLRVGSTVAKDFMNVQI